MSAYEVVKPFKYACDGVTLQDAATGPAPADLPEDAISGLVKEGYIREAVKAKAVKAAPENKAVASAPETKAADAETGADVGLTDAEINADLEALGVEFDPASDREVRLALRAAGRAQREQA